MQKDKENRMSRRYFLFTLFLLPLVVVGSITAGFNFFFTSALMLTALWIFDIYHAYKYGIHYMQGVRIGSLVLRGGVDRADDIMLFAHALYAVSIALLVLLGVFL